MSPTSAPSAPSPGVWRLPLRVRFGDCDPVGIVYFPRYFDWFHRAMEDWIEGALGRPYAQLLRRYGFPTVHTECDYKRPCAFGDDVIVELRLGRLGRSSFRLLYRITDAQDQTRATGATDVVLMGTDPTLPDHLRAIPIPDELRSSLLAFGPIPETNP